MTPKLCLLALPVLWTIYILSRWKAEYRRRSIRRATTWSDELGILSTSCGNSTSEGEVHAVVHSSSHREKAQQGRGYFFYVIHAGTPTKVMLNKQADESNVIKLPTVLVWNGPYTHYSSAHSVWMDATRINMHHNAHCWTSVDKP